MTKPEFVGDRVYTEIRDVVYKDHILVSNYRWLDWLDVEHLTTIGIFDVDIKEILIAGAK